MTSSVPIEMSRSVSQLLFSYLPDRTVNWEDGAGIVRLGAPRLDGAWPPSAAQFVLEEVSSYLERWRQRGGAVDSGFPPVRSADRFTVGTPRGIAASILETALYCRDCCRFLPQRPRAHGDQLLCPGCGRQTLRQIGYVFVHGCGHLEPIGRTIPYESRQQAGTIFRAPIRCATCGDGAILRVDDRAERLAALKIYCERCRQEVISRLLARCPRCFPRFFREAEAGANPGQLAFRSAMRITRHSANNAYYPHTISILRLDRPRIPQASPEQAWLDALLPAPERTGPLGAAQALTELVDRLREAERRGDHQQVAELRAAIAVAATAPAPAREEAPRALQRRLPADVEQAVRECVALLSSVRRVPVAAAAATHGGEIDPLATALRRLGIARVEVVTDLPVVTAVFGYTRRSADPTYEEEGAAEPFPTCIRPFPVLDAEASRILSRPQAEGTVPILAREGLHEGLAFYLDVASVVRWLRESDVQPAGDTEREQMTSLLTMLEPIDRFYEDVWQRRVRRLVFGLLHTFSHCALKALGRVGGIEATSVAEYLFTPLLGTVVYSTATVQLGGVQSVARQRMMELLDVMQEEAGRCLYDPDCIHREGACHACVHVPEISCRVFNHGLSRSFLVGGRTPWLPTPDQRQMTGYWEITAV